MSFRFLSALCLSIDDDKSQETNHKIFHKKCSIGNSCEQIFVCNYCSLCSMPFYNLNNDKLLYNGYTNALKFAHYLPFGVTDHSNLSICDYPIRYDAHHDVGVITLQKLVDIQRGFQILVNN